MTTAALPDHDVLLEMYRRMLRIRRFDERAVDRHGKGEIPGPMHTSIGQEAAAVGACLAVGDSDYMTGTHRSHGHPIAKGAALNPLMAELMGKATGVCGGKGGSMHLADFSVGSLGESGIVASAMPIAVGAALSAQIRGSGQVALCFFGDGAANEGAFHESLNLAGAWRLPVIFLCENNQYAITTLIESASGQAVIADRAVAYGMPGVRVDGQDVLAVYEAVRAAADRARAGDGPSLVEAVTYRYREHSEMGPNFKFGEYRTDAEIDKWRERDPITILHDVLISGGQISEGAATEDELAAIAAEVEEEVAAAVTFARRSEFPSADLAYVGMYVDDLRPPATGEPSYA